MIRRTGAVRNTSLGAVLDQIFPGAGQYTIEPNNGNYDFTYNGATMNTETAGLSAVLLHRYPAHHGGPDPHTARPARPPRLLDLPTTTWDREVVASLSRAHGQGPTRVASILWSGLGLHGSPSRYGLSQQSIP